MIKLNNNYFIESDGTQYILKSKKQAFRKETNEPYMNEVIEGYYGNLHQALDGYCRHSMLDKVNECDLTLVEVKKLLNELKEEVKAYE